MQSSIIKQCLFIFYFGQNIQRNAGLQNVGQKNTNSKWQSEFTRPPPRAGLANSLQWVEDGVERHNYYRQLHGVPDLKLNMTLCEISQAWAYQRARGVLGHNPDRGRVGENILTICVSPPYSVSNSTFPGGNYAVDEWYNEIEFYDYANCISKEPGKLIGHFTQVIWNTTLEVGMASTEYYDEKNWNCAVIVANYYPPGNVVGLCQKNVFSKRNLASSGLKIQRKQNSIFPIFAALLSVTFILL